MVQPEQAARLCNGCNRWLDRAQDQVSPYLAPGPWAPRPPTNPVRRSGARLTECMRPPPRATPTCSRGELRTTAQRLAHGLRTTLNVKPGDVVITFSPNSAHYRKSPLSPRGGERARRVRRRQSGRAFDTSPNTLTDLSCNYGRLDGAGDPVRRRSGVGRERGVQPNRARPPARELGRQGGEYFCTSHLQPLVMLSVLADCDAVFLRFWLAPPSSRSRCKRPRRPGGPRSSNASASSWPRHATRRVRWVTVSSS